MRIAYIGNFEPEYSTENDVRKAFESLGHEVIQLQENEPVELMNMFDLNFDLLLITSTWDDAIPLRAWLTFIKTCAKAGIPTATLHLDTFWNTSRGNREWWQNPMFHTAYIFTADGDHQDKWKLFGKNHIWLPPAVRHDAVEFGKFRKEYECDVAFVGSNGLGYHEDVWGYRSELLMHLREMCSRNGWSFRNPGGDEPKIDRNTDMNDFYESAKVVVGDSLCLNKEDSKYWSDRVPETLGRGGMLIMPRIEELIKSKLLTNDTSYDWGDWADLENKIKFWLDDYNNNNQSKHKLRTINSHLLVKKDHTYVNRVQTILKEVGLNA